MAHGGGDYAVLPYDVVILITGIISFICLFLTWAVVNVDNAMASLTNEMSGLDVLDQQNYDLRYYPLLACAFGLLTAVFAMLQMVLRNKSLCNVSIITQMLTLIFAFFFISRVSINETIDPGGIISINHAVSAGYASYVVLVCTIVGLVSALIQALRANTEDSANRLVYLGSVGKKKSAIEKLSLAGLNVDAKGRIVKEDRIYGRVYGTYIRLYDLDLTHNAVAFKDLREIRESEGVVTVVYVVGASKAPLNTFSSSPGEGAYEITGRGRQPLPQ